MLRVLRMIMVSNESAMNPIVAKATSSPVNQAGQTAGESMKRSEEWRQSVEAWNGSTSHGMGDSCKFHWMRTGPDGKPSDDCSWTIKNVAALAAMVKDIYPGWAPDGKKPMDQVTVDDIASIYTTVTGNGLESFYGFGVGATLPRRQYLRDSGETVTFGKFETPGVALLALSIDSGDLPSRMRGVSKATRFPLLRAYSCDRQQHAQEMSPFSFLLSSLPKDKSTGNVSSAINRLKEHVSVVKKAQAWDLSLMGTVGDDIAVIEGDEIEKPVIYKVTSCWTNAGDKDQWSLRDNCMCDTADGPASADESGLRLIKMRAIRAPSMMAEAEVVGAHMLVERHGAVERILYRTQSGDDTFRVASHLLEDPRTDHACKTHRRDETVEFSNKVQATEIVNFH